MFVRANVSCPLHRCNYVLDTHKARANIQHLLDRQKCSVIAKDEGPICIVQPNNALSFRFAMLASNSWNLEIVTTKDVV